MKTMKSMTGFGYFEVADSQYQVSLELKAYNNRYLDLNITLPPGLGPVEQTLRDWLKDHILRGRVELYCRIRETETQAKALVDQALVDQYFAAFRQIKASTRLRGPITLDHLLGVEGIIRTDRQRDPLTLQPLILKALEQAFIQFEEARTREGLPTVQDIRDQLGRISGGLEIIVQNAGAIETAIHENLRARFTEVLGNEIDENRILTEVASLIVKHSINEEISRIKTHLHSFEEGLNSGEPGGKRLDFLSQELNREINTIGSKSFLTAITTEVIQMKDALENIREQLRNLE
ncbi:MAG: YicC family protein [Spirochaetales bacterium]|nr:YicC family protein [Spirochaetales bacterium]